jgi:hypothetical protein
MKPHPPGAIVLTRVPGWRGQIIDVAQWLNGDYSPWNHCGIVDNSGVSMIAAQPGGAARQALSELDSYIVYLPYTGYDATPVAEVAETLLGTPYSFLDYFSIALLRLHIRPRFVVNFVANTHHMICSQLVDYCWTKGTDDGLFDDGRFFGDVTPGDEATLMHTEDWAEV